MKIRVFTISMLLLGAICAGGVHFGAAIASNNGFGTARPSEPASAKDSDTTMDAALAVMKKRAYATTPTPVIFSSAAPCLLASAMPPAENQTIPKPPG